jgi:hypothetical protein
MTWRGIALIGPLRGKENPTTTSGWEEVGKKEKRSPEGRTRRREGLIQE